MTAPVVIGLDLSLTATGVAGPDGGTPHGLPLADRFWMKVQIGDGCWIWLGSRSGHGYGRIATSGPGERKRIDQAHRVAWELEHGPIPEGMWVLHRCDNPPCVRVSHLFLGTCQDNVDDMVKKGRHGAGRTSRPGMANPVAKITDDDVRLIRSLAASGIRYREISERVGLSHAQISRIVTRQRWGHVA